MMRGYTALARHGGASARHPFDAELGIETGGYLPGYLLASGHSADEHNTAYAGCVPGSMRRILATIPDPERWEFLDLGCGKGRALAVAAEFPFRRLRGIELNPELAQIARANAAILAARYSSRPAIVIEQGDASTPSIAGDTIVMFYHSFHAALVERLADSLAPVAEAGTSILVAYFNPVYGAVLDARPWLSRWSAESFLHHVAERPYALGERETAVIWQAGPAKLSPRPGATQSLDVDAATWQSRLG
jgi:SAM-dependent methyltransferase